MKNKCSLPIGFVSIVLFAVLISGCKKDEPLSQQEVTFALLTSAAAWQTPTVTIDGVDQSDLYTGFTITFGDKAYSSANGTPVWNAVGVWMFKDETAKVLVVDNDFEAEIISISEESLELTFQWQEDTFEPGRKESIKGKNNFKLKKK